MIDGVDHLAALSASPHALSSTSHTQVAGPGPQAESRHMRLSGGMVGAGLQKPSVKPRPRPASPSALAHLTPLHRTAGVSAISIALGFYHTCAIELDGGVKCWGYNGFGELGIGNKEDHTSPVDVPGGMEEGRPAVCVCVRVHASVR